MSVSEFRSNKKLACDRIFWSTYIFWCLPLLGTGLGFDDIEFESGVDIVDPIGDEAGILASNSVSLWMKWHRGP